MTNRKEFESLLNDLLAGTFPSGHSWIISPWFGGFIYSVTIFHECDNGNDLHKSIFVFKDPHIHGVKCPFCATLLKK